MITFKCEICGKEKTSSPAHYSKMKHHYCSRKCMAIAFRKNPPSTGLKQYRAQIRQKTVEKYIDAINDNNLNITERGVILKAGVCAMITAHSQMLKDDPERLTTEFMKRMVGKNCEEGEK